MRGWAPAQGGPVGDKVLPADLELLVAIGEFQPSKEGLWRNSKPGTRLTSGPG